MKSLRWAVYVPFTEVIEYYDLELPQTVTTSLFYVSMVHEKLIVYIGLLPLTFFPILILLWK